MPAELEERKLRCEIRKLQAETIKIYEDMSVERVKLYIYSMSSIGAILSVGVAILKYYN